MFSLTLCSATDPLSVLCLHLLYRLRIDLLRLLGLLYRSQNLLLIEEALLIELHICLDHPISNARLFWPFDRASACLITPDQASKPSDQVCNTCKPSNRINLCYRSSYTMRNEAKMSSVHGGPHEIKGKCPPNPCGSPCTVDPCTMREPHGTIALAVPVHACLSLGRSRVHTHLGLGCCTMRSRPSHMPPRALAPQACHRPPPASVAP